MPAVFDNAISVSAGYYASQVAVSSTGTVGCTYSPGASYQCGSFLDNSHAPYVDITHGRTGGCAVRADFTVDCFGDNTFPSDIVLGYQASSPPTPPTPYYVDGMRCYDTAIPDFDTVTYLSGSFMNLS